MKETATPLEGIGHTPIVRLRHVVPAGAAEVWVKIESGNPTGSYKDRMARAIIDGAERRGDLRAGMTVIECTGGSTGSSLAFVCAVKGYALHVISSDAVAREKLDTMRAFGAKLELMESVGGKFTPDLMPRMLARTRTLAETPGMFWTDQFHNRDAFDGYAPMGREMFDAVGPGAVFVAAVGTAGMLMGVGAELRRLDAHVRIVALEPESSPVLTTGRAGAHHIDGIAPGFVPPHFDRELAPEVRTVDEADARVMARRLAAEEGVFAGTSTGLNVVGAISVAMELGPGHRVVTVAVDSGLKYLAGDLFKT